MQPGSNQGLTQTVTLDGKTNTNAVISTISVSGDGTDANIGLDQELTATNGNRQNGTPNSIFTANHIVGEIHITSNVLSPVLVHLLRLIVFQEEHVPKNHPFFYFHFNFIKSL